MGNMRPYGPIQEITRKCIKIARENVHSVCTQFTDLLHLPFFITMFYKHYISTSMALACSFGCV